MPGEADELEELQKGSRSHIRKFNKLVAAVRKLQADQRRGQRTPLILYLETDSEPIAYEVDASAFIVGATAESIEDIS